MRRYMYIQAINVYDIDSMFSSFVLLLDSVSNLVY